MVNNCINKLNEPININKVIIKTSKKVRRHPSQHGIKFSNSRIDSLMLLNLLYYIINLKDNLKKYHHKLKYDSKGRKYILK